MAKFGQGQPTNLGGRHKGVPNKINREFKELLQQTMMELQEDKRANLLTWAKENTTEFYKIASKLIPTEMKNDVTLTDNTIKVIYEDSSTQEATQEPRGNIGFIKEV
jgi:hypothetical protein